MKTVVATALGIRGRTALEWLKMAYDATGADLHEVTRYVYVMEGEL